jgi:sulfur-oxidizing protein SoxY
LLEAGVAIAVGRALPATAADDILPVFAELTAYLAGRTPRMERLVLDLPRLADNGNAVPMKLAMPGPFAPGAHVRAIALFAQRNPVPKLAEFEFLVPSPRVEIESRVRLAGTQRVVAIATMADGDLYGAYADVTVTLSACLDGT